MNLEAEIKNFLTSDSQQKGQWKDEYLRWTIRYTLTKKKRGIHLEMNATKGFTGSDFTAYEVSRDGFLSFFTPSANFKSKGEITDESAVLLSNPNALSMLMARRAKFELRERTLIYSCSIRWKQMDNISRLVEGFLIVVKEFQNRDV